MLTTQGGTPTKITEVNFTFALDGGMWIKDEVGQVTWMGDTQGMREYGQETWVMWHKTAYHNGWTGMWYKV